MKIIFPEEALTDISSSPLANYLRELTRTVVTNNLAEKHMGLLGGDWGYGTDFENDVFMIHPFCWCEKDDCPWCVACICPETTYHYFIDGKEVSFQEWINFYKEQNAINKLSPQEINKRRGQKHIKECDFCLTGGVSKTKGGINDGRGAPNFWYKPLNIRVWWYKWIGRSMEIDSLEDSIDLKQVFYHCKQSLK